MLIMMGRSELPTNELCVEMNYPIQPISESNNFIIYPTYKKSIYEINQ